MLRNALFPPEMEMLRRVLDAVARDLPDSTRNRYAAHLVLLFQAGVTEEEDLLAALREYHGNAEHLPKAS
jgi:hypothetical protein